MTNLLINNESLKNFIGKVNLDEEKKDFLMSKVPELDLGERERLFTALTEIYLLGLEEEKAIEKINKYWQE